MTPVLKSIDIKYFRNNRSHTGRQGFTVGFKSHGYEYTYVMGQLQGAEVE
ncbi:hypothetical protein PYJP_11540 [Pyrofollis japonicus]|nr:hypothetical protein PYJP_11540 [Pyrofollis japonicus]